MSEGSLGVLSIVHLDHGRETGWTALAPEMLRSSEVPVPPLATAEVSEEGGEEKSSEGE